MNQDLLFGALAPILLAIILPLSGYCFGAIVLVVIVWFGLAVLGLGGNRRS
jgi:hypothetical protein